MLESYFLKKIGKKIVVKHSTRIAGSRAIIRTYEIEPYNVDCINKKNGTLFVRVSVRHLESGTTFIGSKCAKIVLAGFLSLNEVLTSICTAVDPEFFKLEGNEDKLFEQHPSELVELTITE